MIFNRKKRGFTLVELIVVLVIVGVMLAAGVGRSARAKTRGQASEVAATVSTMVAAIQGNRSASGTYAGLSATEINGMSVVQKPLAWNSGSSTITDPWGNALGFAGNAAGATPTFVVTIGGATSPLDKEVCNIIATTLVDTATIVNIGASSAITTTNGIAGGGSVYKAAGGTPNASNLSTGCMATNPVIALQFS